MLREWRILLASVGVHVAILAGAQALVALGWVRAGAVVAERSVHDTIEIDISEAASSPLLLPAVRPDPLPPVEPASAIEEPRGEARVAGEAPRAVPRGERAPGEPGQVEPPSGAPSKGPAPDEYDPLPGQDGVFHALPGVNAPSIGARMLDEAPRSAPAPTTTPRAREVDKDIAGKVIREAMKDKDKSKGIEIAAAGTAASAVQASLYGSDLPSESRGTIAIQLDGNGNVVGVKVVSMVGGNADQWERVAQNAAAQVRARKNSLPDEYKKGAIVYIDAHSQEQLPAGKGSGISGNTATFDVSNIGAHKRQVVRVSTRVVAVR